METYLTAEAGVLALNDDRLTGVVNAVLDGILTVRLGLGGAAMYHEHESLQKQRRHDVCAFNIQHQYASMTTVWVINYRYHSRQRCQLWLNAIPISQKRALVGRHLALQHRSLRLLHNIVWRWRVKVEPSLLG